METIEGIICLDDPNECYTFDQKLKEYFVKSFLSIKVYKKTNTEIFEDCVTTLQLFPNTRVKNIYNDIYTADKAFVESTYCKIPYVNQYIFPVNRSKSIMRPSFEYHKGHLAKPTNFHDPCGGIYFYHSRDKAEKF